MKIVALSGSVVGSKTRTMIDEVVKQLHDYDADTEVTLLDLAEYDITFSDGRQFIEYSGDTGYVAQTLMAADAIVIGTLYSKLLFLARSKTSLTCFRCRLLKTKLSRSLSQPVVRNTTLSPSSS